jgi:hypothetical protein
MDRTDQCADLISGFLHDEPNRLFGGLNRVPTVRC